MRDYRKQIQLVELLIGSISKQLCGDASILHWVSQVLFSFAVYTAGYWKNILEQNDSNVRHAPSICVIFSIQRCVFFRPLLLMRIFPAQKTNIPTKNKNATYLLGDAHSHFTHSVFHSLFRLSLY